MKYMLRLKPYGDSYSILGPTKLEQRWDGTALRGEKENVYSQCGAKILLRTPLTVQRRFPTRSALPKRCWEKGAFFPRPLLSTCKANMERIPPQGGLGRGRIRPSIKTSTFRKRKGKKNVRLVDPAVGNRRDHGRRKDEKSTQPALKVSAVVVSITSLARCLATKWLVAL